MYNTNDNVKVQYNDFLQKYIAINNIAKSKGICYPSQTPHKVPSFLCDFMSFREKEGTQKKCRGIRIQRNKSRKQEKAKKYL